MRASARRDAILAYALLTFACTVPARSTTGDQGATPNAASLTVEVRELDVDGPIRGSFVRLIRITGDTVVQQTDSLGRAEFPAVSAGRVELAVARIGYAPLQRAIDVTPGCQTRVRVRLRRSGCPLTGCGDQSGRLDVERCHASREDGKHPASSLSL